LVASAVYFRLTLHEARNPANKIEEMNKRNEELTVNRFIIKI